MEEPIICISIDMTAVSTGQRQIEATESFTSMRTNQAPVPRASELVFYLHGESRQNLWANALENCEIFTHLMLIAIGERITQL